MQFPGGIRSVEVAGILLDIALEGAVQSVGDTAGLHQRDVAEFPRNGYAAHVVNQQRFHVRRLLHGELPAEVLPAGTQVQNTTVGIRRVRFGILLDVHVQGTGLVRLGSHAENVGNAFSERKFLLKLQIPGFLARFLDVEADNTIVDLHISLAAPEVYLPVGQRIFFGEVAILNQVRAHDLRTDIEILLLNKVRNDTCILDSVRVIDADFLAPSH